MEDASTPGYQENPSQNHPLWHDTYGDLTVFENFERMHEGVLALHMDGALDDGNWAQRVINANLMAEKDPKFTQAYNYHYRPEAYKPEFIPPKVRVESAAPPERQSQVAAAARSQPEGLSVSWTPRKLEQEKGQTDGSSRGASSIQGSTAPVKKSMGR
ncbi:hypothetical protein [Streptomyces sp. NPDC006012]|uniref:hypothetical protein n=1 Tax=Streptomyces sp. NPDC006012 TaxID=3364739 RepID=UPI003691CE1C